MKALKIISIILIVLFGIYVAAAFMAPEVLIVEKSTVINAPVSTVYPQVACFKNWEPWNPWDAMDSTNTNAFSEQECGVGSWYSWKGQQTGEGRQDILEAREDEYIKCSLVFGVDPTPQTSEWFFEETEGGTKVTWNFIGTEASFFSRPMNLMGEYFLSAAYESGLAALKEVAETAPVVKDLCYDVEIIELPTMNYLLISGEIHPADIAAFYTDKYPKIMGYVAENGGEMSGFPSGIYFSWSDTLTKMAAGIPVNKEIDGNDEIEARVFGGGQALQIEYYGPYDGVGPAHYAIEDYSNENEIDLEGFAMEIYVTDPAEEPDTSKWLTRIVYPIVITD